ncbi:ABC transporter substrate-binding protein [Paenibacillus oceani]|uniref:Extracellular solute-binding protein n=1 Tax=Paenibacillus oceani TaxID=2772510 RepID=A0A927GZA3_9BACL|nr:extracellular solute-binding protein [Paenibacillus oceani]MBD2862038.1 extracellular solute-binding protein [Paenibacillus oceani]
MNDRGNRTGKAAVGGMTAIAIASMLVLSGCGGGAGTPADPAKDQPNAGEQTTKPGAPAVDTSPVTLKVFFGTGFEDKDIQNLIADPVKKKYPYISIKTYRPGQGTSIQELIAAGDTPDIVFTWNGDLGLFKELGLLEDMSGLALKHGVDINRFEPVVLDAIRSMSNNKELAALPFAVNFNALYYNKDIFDKFGVAYPKDGLTWEELIPMAEKLSRIEDGTTYRGLDPENINRMSMPLSLTMVDAKTNKASVNNEGWKSVFELAKRIWSIPNNKPGTLNATGRTQFMNDKNVAMLPVQNILNLGLEAAAAKGLNWDMAQYPSYKNSPNVYGHVDTHIFSVTKPSKYKDQAMQVISVITSDEVQLLSTRTTARLSPLKNTELKKQLGADMAFLKGKHLEAIFKSTPAPAPTFSLYEFQARAIVQKTFQMYFDGTDLNTTLRDAEMQVNQMLETSVRK